MAQGPSNAIETEEIPDFSFNPEMIQGKWKQRILTQCGFHNVHAAQVRHLKMGSFPTQHCNLLAGYKLGLLCYRYVCVFLYGC